jgi:cell division protein FtsB
MKMTLFTRFLLVLFAGGIIFALSSAWKELERSKRIEAEVDKLRTEAARVRSENQTLTERIAYFSTDDYQEKEAKEKLGLKKADETIVLVNPGVLPQTSEESKPAGIRHDADENLPNYRRWWNYFFPEPKN